MDTIKKSCEEKDIAKLCEFNLLIEPQFEEFNDVTLLKSGIWLDREALSQTKLQAILCRFFNFYFHGVVKIEDRLPVILADVIANASTLEKNLWDFEKNYTDTFSLTNSSVTKDLLQDTIKSLDNPVFSNSKQISTKKAAYTELLTDYAIHEGQKFKDFIAAQIKSIDSFVPAETARLKRLASFLALTLLRAMTKTKYQLNNAFFEKQYRSDLVVLVGWSKELPFYPPCSQCIETCIEILPNSTIITNIFMLLVSEYIRSMEGQYCNTIKIKFLYTSVLMHTAKHGLGILQLLERACLATGLKWNKLFEMTNLNVTADSWKAIKKFFDLYLRKENVQYGYNWARIINERYLRGYTPEDHLPLAGILLGIVEQVENLEMWNIEWAEKHKELREMRLYGNVVYHLAKLNLAKVRGFGESVDILEAVRVLAAQRKEEVRNEKCGAAVTQH